MQHTLTFVRLRKWLLVLAGVAFLFKGIKIIFSHPVDFSDYLFSYFEVIGGISYIVLGFLFGNIDYKPFKTRLPIAQRRKLFYVFGAVLLVYVGIVLKLLYLK